ncbi:MAG: D-aminoacyl-tRNA deacylase [Fimbriimonadaceae bacterium]|nr:D-aminoacyl-tRNA deacylase [Fimbriimonadaceae bacterium]
MQRVARAEVRVGGRVVGSCGVGLVALVAAERSDAQANAAKMADRIAGLRIFSDCEGKMNLALADAPGGPGAVLAISNFTVAGDTAKSRRPSFVGAAGYEEGRALFETMVAELRARGVHVETGEFGADMQVEMVNDGPVTVTLQT